MRTRMDLARTMGLHRLRLPTESPQPKAGGRKRLARPVGPRSALVEDGNTRRNSMAATRRRAANIRDRHRAAIARTKPPCHICGEPIDYTLPWTHPRAYVVDHIIPLARGGSDTLSNCAAAHKDCNRLKADKDYAPIIRRSGSIDRPTPWGRDPASGGTSTSGA